MMHRRAQVLNFNNSKYLSPRISHIEARAFVHLDNLQKLELQFNRLTEFSLNAFENCTKFPMHPMTVNVSHNDIKHLTPMNNNRVPFIQVGCELGVIGCQCCFGWNW